MADFRQILNKDIRNKESVVAVGEDFFILDNPQFVSTGRFPYKNDWLIATLCESGSASGVINLREYRVQEGGLIIILPGQVIVRSEVSDDFNGKILLMSRKFTESLDIGRTRMLTAGIGQRPYYQFEETTMEIARTYISSCKAMIRQNGDSPVIWDILRLLSQVFFLGASSLLKKKEGALHPKSYGRLTEDFLGLVEREYREHRQLDYYASELKRSVKYLSRHIKEETGQNATDWIDRHVILDAQAQLLSTKNTIQKISESLGFPSQSFFGKYFKRVTGQSPKEFRKQSGYSN
jgi:AraC family transcriptional activator of pobA